MTSCCCTASRGSAPSGGRYSPCCPRRSARSRPTGPVTDRAGWPAAAWTSTPPRCWPSSTPAASSAPCSPFAWKLTPWLARAGMRRPISRLGADGAKRRHVNTYVWGFTRWDHGPLWRTFLAEQRALMGEAGQLAALAAQVKVPVLLLADRKDTLVPFRTAVALSRSLPDAQLVPVEGAGHHRPLRAPAEVASEMAGFLESLDG